jgi:glycogen synthase
MSQKKIVIASVLKSVNDSRNYEKIGISISRLTNYKVHVVGQAVPDLPQGGKIIFNPIYTFSRLSWNRLFASFRFFLLLRKIKPDIVVATTAELLIPSVIYKLLFRAKLVYDVQENYFRNLIYTDSFPIVLKHLLAVLVRGLEYLSKPAIDYYLVAEKTYFKECAFIGKNSILIENKCRQSLVKTTRVATTTYNHFLYTGTIAESYGIFETVSLIEKIREHNQQAQLTIIGYAAQPAVLKKLKDSISSKPYIHLIGGDTLVRHDDILKKIAEADMGIVSYLPNKSTEGCIPTKLYEYWAFQLPYLVTSHNGEWVRLTKLYQAGIEVDFQNSDIEKLQSALKETTFYKADRVDHTIFWESQEELLIDKLISLF